MNKADMGFDVGIVLWPVKVHVKDPGLVGLPEVLTISQAVTCT